MLRDSRRHKSPADRPCGGSYGREPAQRGVNRRFMSHGAGAWPFLCGQQPAQGPPPESASHHPQEE
jgi:hypothetical protein